MADLRERGKERGAAGRRRGRVRGSRQGQVSVTNGNHALPGQSPRVGVTSDGAENAPRLRVANGEDSQESKPPVKRRVRTHTACAQDSAPPVPWRWGSRTGNRRLQGTTPQPAWGSCQNPVSAWFSAIPGGFRRASWSAQRGDFSAWFCSARRHPCQGRCPVRL